MKKIAKKFLGKIYRFLPNEIKEKLTPKLLQIRNKRVIKLTKKNDLSKKYLRSDFVKHEKLIKEIYGEIDKDYSESVLPKYLLDKILEYLNNEKKLTHNKLLKRFSEKISIDKKLICTDTSSYGDKLIKENSSLFDPAWEFDPNNETIIELQKFISKEFKEYFKSPIVFVNSRAWSMPSNSKPIGPSAFHLDGFEDGHLKIMIYPFGLSDKYGKIVIEELEINNRNAGTVIAFKNSDAVHMSIAGTHHKRIAIEITIMRSMIYSFQKNKSHFNGRHFPSVAEFYNSLNSFVI